MLYLAFKGRKVTWYCQPCWTRAQFAGRVDSTKKRTREYMDIGHARAQGPRSKTRSVAPQGLPVRDHVLVVFFHGAGEAVVALGVGYEIVVVRLGWVEGGF